MFIRFRYFLGTLERFMSKTVKTVNKMRLLIPEEYQRIIIIISWVILVPATIYVNVNRRSATNGLAFLPEEVFFQTMMGDQPGTRPM